MKTELMITRYEGHICACSYEDGRLSGLQLLPETETTARPDEPSAPALGDIYVGRIQNVVHSLNAAFVEVQPGVVCYEPLEEEAPIFLNPKKQTSPAIGDEVLVQIAKEAIKTKAPLASSQLQLTGQSVVVLLGERRIHASRKLPRDERLTALKERLEPELPAGYGVILRTNAYDRPADAVVEELRRLIRQLQDIVGHADCHRVFSCLYRERSPLIQLMDSYGGSVPERIVTDLPVVHDALKQYLETTGTQTALEYVTPALQPLAALYRLDRDWRELTGKRVWLPSGAYLIIEQTEAMVVIDVNTGKSVNHKKKETHLLNINLEAAAEIARQLRLRNLSGIIMIDFIDMNSPADRERLIQTLCEAIRRDRIPTSYIDMTRLQLVELTRKKVRRSLWEELGLS